MVHVANFYYHIWYVNSITSITYVSRMLINFLLSVSKAALQEGIPPQYGMAGMCACSCLQVKCEKLQTGEVDIEDLQKIYKSQDQMKRLCSAISSSKEGSTLYLSVEAAVKKRLAEWTAVKRRREVLSHLCRQIHSVTDKVEGMKCTSLEVSSSS